jgi:hypothetical protein
MPTWVKIVLGIVVAIILLIVVVMYATSGMTKTADHFFAAVHDRQMDKAYADLSADFRAGASQAELTAYLNGNGLADITKTSWGSRSISGGQGELSGTVTNAAGDALPIKLTMVKGDGGWKIQSITKTAAGATVSDAAPSVPPEAQQVALVRDTLGAFVDSVAAQDMTTFRSHVSNLMQQQFTVAQLDQAYRPFYVTGSSLQTIKSMTPAFDRPATINDDGVLVIDGRYPTRPNLFTFTAKYVYEGTDWKPIGLQVNVKPPAETES